MTRTIRPFEPNEKTSFMIDGKPVTIEVTESGSTLFIGTMIGAESDKTDMSVFEAQEWAVQVRDDLSKPTCSCGGEIVHSTPQDVSLSPCEGYCNTCGIVYEYCIEGCRCDLLSMS